LAIDDDPIQLEILLQILNVMKPKNLALLKF